MLKKKIIYNDFCDWVFNVVKAKGSCVWDDRGKKLIDFTSGWNVVNLGWNHPEITEAIIKQAKKNTYASMWTADPIQNKYADLLIRSLPKGLDAVGRATGGTEANEEALKTARAFTGRKKIIGFRDAYHGQSYGTMSLGYLPEYVESISPMVGGFIQMDFPCTTGDDVKDKKVLSQFSLKLGKLLSKKDVAAVVTEAGINTGWGSIYIAPKGYLTLVRKLTKKYGTLLILDEVGTGFSRCGKLFGMQIEGTTPDIVTLAKGMCNGAVAIGVMVTTKEIAERTYKKSNLTSTFGWMPIACAASLKTLQIHKRDKVWEKAKGDGKYMVGVLSRELDGNQSVEDIRGIGMEIGLTLLSNKRIAQENRKFAENVVMNCREKGLHLVLGSENNIQIMPPLTISRRDLDKGMEILIDVVRSI